MTAITSCIFYIYAKRTGLCKLSLIIKLAALNVAFCVLFPLLFSLISGETEYNAPSLGLTVVFSILILLTVIYIFFVMWRVVLRSPSIKLNVPIPKMDTAAAIITVPDMIDTGDEAAADIIDTGDEAAADLVETGDEVPGITEIEGFSVERLKKSVDTAQNLDKMGMSLDIQPNSKEKAIDIIITHAFDSLYGGKLEEAAGYFYQAIGMEPPVSLEIKIAIQLSMVYYELGQADLSLDVLKSYSEKYQDELSDEDKASIEAGVLIIGKAVASIGGDGYEKN